MYSLGMSVEQRVVGLSDALQCLKHLEINTPVLLHGDAANVIKCCQWTSRCPVTTVNMRKALA